MFPENASICFIGAHPDDIELGCGALISNLTNKSRIICITLSKNQKNPNNVNLIQEHYEGLTSLGITKENIILGDFYTRTFLASRQEICDYLFAINNEYKPDIVFAHSLSTTHQDHEVVSKEVLRIFRRKTILGFEIPPTYFGYTPNFFYEVSENDVRNKLKSLNCYKTYKNKYYFSEDLIVGQLVRNGVEIGVRYAEGFDIVRLAYVL